MGAVAARVKREAVVISRARSINVSSKARLDLVETRLMTAHSFSPNTRHMNASKTEKTAKTGLICIARIKGAHRAVKGGFAVTCREISTPEQADALRGTELFTAAENLPEPEEDEFYYSDLIGMQGSKYDYPLTPMKIGGQSFKCGLL